jgi:site-specific DNA-methyltransferase (adenine-specific)
MDENWLYYGDNLDILRRYVKDETVDLVYLDPPFKSNQDYHVFFAEQDGSRSAAQIQAFKDSWRWDQEAANAFMEIVEPGGKVSQAMQAFRQMLGANDMLAYLAMMTPRLVELQRVLKPTGSIYLHCDPTASHYLKILMDAIFGVRNFRNEIIWFYKTGGASKRHFSRKHDVILFYAKTDDYMFNAQKEKSYMMHEYGFKKSDFQKDERGQYTWVYMKDVWEIPSIGSADSQRLGYPTQKPLALLERIIGASTNPGDVVLDPFCGCGTTIDAAQRLERRWIGIDITSIAINLIKSRLLDTYGESITKTYLVRGEPTTHSEAQALAEFDKYQFQWWALGLVGARGVEEKKGADQGIDGRLYFHDEREGGKTKQVIFSVKGGHTSVKDVRDLRGVIEREKAKIGVLITLQEPTQPMRKEAADAGFYTSPWDGTHPRIQILTVAELLAGKRLDMPPTGQVNITFKKAPKNKGIHQQVETLSLPL